MEGNTQEPRTKPCPGYHTADLTGAMKCMWFVPLGGIHKSDLMWP